MATKTGSDVVDGIPIAWTAPVDIMAIAGLVIWLPTSTAFSMTPNLAANKMGSATSAGTYTAILIYTAAGNF